MILLRSFSLYDPRFSGRDEAKLKICGRETYEIKRLPLVLIVQRTLQWEVDKYICEVVLNDQTLVTYAGRRSI